MKIFRFKEIVLLVILMCLSACSGGGDEPIEPTPKPEVVKSEITIDSSIITNGLSFTNEKGEQSISFSTNESWTLNVASTTSGTIWCTASTTSGSKGTANVKFIVTENTSYDDRSVSVTIKAGTASTTFKITQKCADALLVTTKTFEVDKEGGNIEIEVKANISYQMEIADDAKEWICESSSRALTTKKHIFSIASSEEYEKREGEIYIKSGDKQDTVKVYQAGEAILVLSNDNYVISNVGKTISIDVQSNFEYDIQMPDLDWIKEESSSRGLSSHIVNFVISPNETYDNRSTEIIFYDKNSTLKDTVYITQAQKDAIILSQKEFEITAKGGNIKVFYESNVEVGITPNCDWIKVCSMSSRALTTSSFILEISENASSNKRTGTVTISNANGILSEILSVKQKAKSIDSSIEDFKEEEKQEW